MEDIKITHILLTRIRYEMGRSIYRMNCPQSNFYEFTPYIADNGRIEWEGVYYNGREKRYEQYVMDLDTGKLVKDN